MDHGFQHLGGGDHPLAEQAAAGDELLLDGRQLLKRDLHAHVAAADHDAGAFFADLFNIFNARAVFDLGDQLGALVAAFAQEVFHVHEILAAGDKGTGDEVHAVLEAEADVVLVLLAEVDLVQHLAGKAHALAVGQLAAGGDRGDDLAAAHVVHAEGKQTVVQQNEVARLEVVGKSRIADGNAGLVADDAFIGGKGEGVALVQHDFAVFERADAVFGALGVQQDRDRQVQLLADALDLFDMVKVIRMRAVRKVEARDIHAGAAHLCEGGFIRAGGTDGADDFGFSHVWLLLW